MTSEIKTYSDLIQKLSILEFVMILGAAIFFADIFVFRHLGIGIMHLPWSGLQSFTIGQIASGVLMFGIAMTMGLYMFRWIAVNTLIRGIAQFFKDATGVLIERTHEFNPINSSCDALLEGATQLPERNISHYCFAATVLCIADRWVVSDNSVAAELSTQFHHLPVIGRLPVGLAVVLVLGLAVLPDDRLT